MSDRSAMKPIRRVAMIGNYPPRLCGIATFTADTRAALTAAFPQMAVDVIAMDDPDSAHAYPAEVVARIAQGELDDYRAAARGINASGADIVLVQHEYGIFGGSAGELLLRLLDRVDAPVVVTLHTVLEQPNNDQRSVIDGLARRASRLIVMAEKGRDILERVHGIEAAKIAVVPHGVPDRPYREPAPMKARFGLSGRTVLLTFGLLSPNKGIETMIRAMPAIVADNPDALYVVLGATHPHLVAREGEAYRDGLIALADELGVAGHVRLIDGFVEQDQLLDWLEAADVYVTPYLNEAQITSGTLSYAVGIGKPVVSTPYWHAAELLGDGTGMLVPFGDSAGFAAAINALLADPERLETLRRRAYAAGRLMTWEKLAEAYCAIFREAAAKRTRRLFRSVPRRLDQVVPCLDAIERLTDGCGMIQHSIFKVPDRDHGYCVDDNARALMLMHEVEGPLQARADVLATVYASFVQYAWNGDNGRFRNFMGYDRQWLEAEGSEDSFGRSLWSLGVTASRARSTEMRQWAMHLYPQVAPHALPLGSMRTWAFALLGADAVLDAHPGHALSARLVAEFGARLHAKYRDQRRPGWCWFEPGLSYDNARLAEALIRAGRRLGDDAMIEDGLEALGWLDRVQTSDDGRFRAIGTEIFGQPYATAFAYDQQPLEAWATIAAAELALEVSGDRRWAEMGWRAYHWYLGANDGDLPLATVQDGGCFDGLMSDRANLNQGAESVLAFQFACHAAQRLARTGQTGTDDKLVDAIAS